MSVFVSTAAPRAPRGLWELLDAFRAGGVEAVELGFADVEPDERLASRLRGTGLRFVVHNYFPPPAEPFVLNLASPDPEIARRSARLVRRALELASEIEAPVYSVHAGLVTDPVGFEAGAFVLPPADERALEAAAARQLEAVAAALDRAEELGVRLLVENHACLPDDVGKLLLTTSAELRELLDAFPGRDLGLLVDTGHLNVTATTLGFDRVAFVEAVAGHVAAFHLHDNDGRADRHLPAAIDGWAVDLLRQPGFRDVLVSVEARFDDVPAAALYARELERALAPAEAAR